MTTKHVPAQAIVTCDRCGTVCDARRNHRSDGGLTIKETGLDWSGARVADASRSYDLCDVCLSVVAKAIKGAMEVPAAVAVNLSRGNWAVMAPDGRAWALNDFERLVLDVRADLAKSAKEDSNARP